MANLTDSAIRAATVAALKAAATSAGNRVFASRMVPSQAVDGAGAPMEDNFPLLLVYTSDTDEESRSIGGNAYKAQTQVAVECLALVPADVELDDDALDDALDPLAEAVKAALLCTDWSNQFEQVNRVRTTKRLNGEGKSRLCTAQIVFTGAHHTAYFRTTPTTTLDTIRAIHDIDGTTGKEPRVTTNIDLT